MKATTTAKARKSGMTLIELLVSIAIIAMIAAIAVPAVHSARESGRSSACASNLRQLHLANDMHASSMRCYPSNGGYAPEISKILSRSGKLEEIMTVDFEVNWTFKWGIGNPSLAPENQTGSWCYSILKYLDEVAAYQQLTVQRKQPIFLCPSRARPEPAVPVMDLHGNYLAAGWAWAKTDFIGNAYVFSNLGEKLNSPASITDGLASTIGIGEKAFDRGVHVATSWYWDEPIFSGGSQGTARAGTKLVPDGYDITYKESWGSAHRGYSQFVFLDGSVRRISYDVDEPSFAAMLTISGNESAPRSE